jgi:hypothetical protein
VRVQQPPRLVKGVETYSSCNSYTNGYASVVRCYNTSWNRGYATFDVLQLVSGSSTLGFPPFTTGARFTNRNERRELIFWEGQKPLSTSNYNPLYDIHLYS